MNHYSAPVDLTPEGVVGVLCFAGPSALPVRTWPVEAALEQLSERVARDTCLGRAVGRWPRVQGPTGTQFRGVREITNSLLAAGALLPMDGGSGLEVKETWRQAHRGTFDCLSSEEKSALKAVAQRLVARTSMLSKKAKAGSLWRSANTESAQTRRQELVTR